MMILADDPGKNISVSDLSHI